MTRTSRISAGQRAAFDARGVLVALVADGAAPLAFLTVPEGTAPLTRDQIVEHLTALSPDELAAVVEACIAEGQSIAESSDPITADVLARINLLGDAREVAEERIGAVAAEETQRQEEAQAALARLAPKADDADGDAGEGGDDADADASTDADADAQTPVPVTASSGRRRQTTALPRPGVVPSSGRGNADTGQRSATYAVPRATATLTAAAGLEVAGLTSGAVIDSREKLGEAMSSKLRSLRNVTGGNGENVPVASLAVDYPEERILGKDASVNAARIRQATDSDALVAAAQYARDNGNALVAAGGLCAPIEYDYSVPVLGSTARPVKDALTNFGADRGGIKWRQHLSFADFAGATSVWTIDNDAAVGTAQAIEKPCLDVECPDDAEAYVEALTMCMTFSNVSTRFDPEATAANIEAAQVAHARFAENRLLAQIAAMSTTVTQAAEVSLIRDYLVGFDKLIAAYRNFYRLDDTIALHTAVPRWLRDAIRVDLVRGAGLAGGLEALAVSDAQIAGWLQTRNVNPTWHLDGRGATVAAAGTEVDMEAQFYGALVDNAPLPDFPDQVETLLWVEGDMLHLDGGTLDLGVVRDSTLNQVNRYKQFSESFEGVAHRGVECVRMVTTLSATGMQAGTKDTEAILAS